MDIIYLGHSSFKISGKAASVITDPFDPSMVGIKYPKTSADIITISHAHPDHNFVGSVEAEGTVKVVDGPGEYEIKGISIMGYPSFHDNEKGAARGENTIYVFEHEGFRLAHLGDLGHTLTEDQIRDIGDIDVLFIPVGGEYTIGPDEATKVTRAIEPKIVVPMHFQAPGMNPEVFASVQTVDAFVTALGSTPEHMKKISLKPGVALSEEMKLIILER